LVTEVDVGAGSKYTSVKFTESLTLQGLSASIGSVGDAEDQALAVSIIRCL
jgi:putative transposase